MRVYHISRPHSRFIWIYLIIGVPLFGLISLTVLVGEAVILHRMPVAQSQSSPLVVQPSSGTLAGQAPHMLATTPAVTLAPSSTRIPNTALPTASPTQAYSCAEAQGQVLSKTFYSRVAKSAEAYRIYLPPCYAQTNRRYPYAILLHGVDDNETEWTDTLGVNRTLDQGIGMRKLAPMILVMPNGGERQYDNWFLDGDSFESLILNDLLPEVENNYCAWNAQAGRALAGISRGGFWVFEIGFRHPDVFGELAGHSAYFDPDNAPPANNPLNLAQTVTFAPNMAPRIWLDAAADDTGANQNLAVISQTLVARHINPGYTVYPNGGHAPAYWQSHLEDYLAFYGQNWPLNPLTLPTCK